MMIGILGKSIRMRRSVYKPPIPGKFRSSKTASNAAERRVGVPPHRMRLQQLESRIQAGQVSQALRMFDSSSITRIQMIGSIIKITSSADTWIATLDVAVDYSVKSTNFWPILIDLPMLANRDETGCGSPAVVAVIAVLEIGQTAFPDEMPCGIDTRPIASPAAPEKTAGS